MKAIQASYTLTRPGCQDRVYALPFRRVPKTNVRCSGATHTQPRTYRRMACVQGRRHPCTAAATNSHDKKKIAFIKHELHEEADAVTAMFSLRMAGSSLPTRLRQGAVVALDNSPFMDRTLRADTLGDGVGDPKRTVFVGSLDFASHEEDLRDVFRGRC
jgi:hypothetical protein